MRFPATKPTESVFKFAANAYAKRIIIRTLVLVTVLFICFTPSEIQPQTFPATRGAIIFENDSGRPLRFANAGRNDELLPFEVNGYWGLLNQNRNVLVLPVFDWIDVGIEGLARATVDGKTGFLLGNGDWRFDPIYAYADRFEEGFAVVGEKGRFGYIDRAGKNRSGFRFDAALRFKDNVAGVRIGDRCGFINTNFDAVTEFRFTAVRSFHEGFAAVRTPGAQNTIDEEQNEDVRESTESTSGVWGFINRTGRFAFRDETGQIQALGDFNDGLAKFQVDGRWGYLDRAFRVALPPTYEDARDFTQGSAAVKQNGRWGYINRSFNVTVPFQYESADDFDDTGAMITLKGKRGFIDRTGRVIIAPQFDWAEPFRLNLSRVSVGDSFAYLRTSGFVFYEPNDAKAGFIDVTTGERIRRRFRLSDRGNRLLLPLPPRPLIPAPYPPEFQYDEGLWSETPPGPPSEQETPAPGNRPPKKEPGSVDRV